jgi:DNA-binding NarL/FixJ family response regulator
MIDTSKCIRVMVVDDHPLFREGVAAILSGEDGLSVVAKAADGWGAVELFRRFVPDVTLMDLEMPRLGGIEAIHTIRKDHPQAAILALTTDRRDRQATEALKAGAKGYVLKSMLRRELIDAIRAVHIGKRYMPAEMVRYATDESLTSKEILILESVAAGQ